MNIFIIGISGRIGGLLAGELIARGNSVSGLVRSHAQRVSIESRGGRAQVGDLAEMTTDELARAFGAADAVVFTAGSNGGSREITQANDGDGVTKALSASHVAGVTRFGLVSVLPESWRERDLGENVEYYFAVKKAADIAVTRSGLDWLILRPSLLVDGAGIGTVSLGPAEFHDQITREDVVHTLAELLHEHRISGQILELNAGSTVIHEAVQANVRP